MQGLYLNKPIIAYPCKGKDTAYSLTAAHEQYGIFLPVSPPIQRRRCLIGLSSPKVGYYTVFLIRVLLLIPFVKVLLIATVRVLLYVGSRRK